HLYLDGGRVVDERLREVVRDDVRMARPIVHGLVAVERHELAADPPRIDDEHRHLAHAAVHAGRQPGRPAADHHHFVHRPSSPGPATFAPGGAIEARATL